MRPISTDYSRNPQQKVIFYYLFFHIFLSSIVSSWPPNIFDWSGYLHRRSANTEFVWCSLFAQPLCVLSSLIRFCADNQSQYLIYITCSWSYFQIECLSTVLCRLSFTSETPMSHLCPSVKNLGVTLDSNLSMSQHISNACKAAYIQIRHISSIRHLLTTQATQTLVCSLVLSRLDYCNSLLSGCPQYLLDKLQKVQNAAARLVCKAKKSDHIHPILKILHWLPVTHRIQYKISAICFNSISGTAPQYLSDLLQPYTPARQLRSASDTRTFVTPRVNTKTFGERSFSYAGPSVWNNSPQTLHHSDSTTSFKAALKTHLFNNYL